jgi:hypothetical protein
MIYHDTESALLAVASIVQEFTVEDLAEFLTRHTGKSAVVADDCGDYCKCLPGGRAVWILEGVAE